MVYTIGSYSVSYREGGLFAVYGGTSIESVGPVLDLIRAEFEGVRRLGISENELERAKNQIRGALVLGQESTSNRMMRMGKSKLYLGRVVSMEELIEKITNVTQEDVQRVAASLFEPGFAVAAIGPFESAKVVTCS